MLKIGFHSYFLDNFIKSGYNIIMEVIKMKRLKRPYYLDWLIHHKDKQIIKVVTGVRRCGKSTLFEIFQDYLLESNVSTAQIISINFEDIEFEELLDYRSLYKYVKERLISDKMNYIFLDEIL